MEAEFYADRSVPVQRQAFDVVSLMPQRPNPASASTAAGLFTTTLSLTGGGGQHGCSAAPAEPDWPQYGKPPHQSCCALLSGFGSLPGGSGASPLDGPAQLLSATAHSDGSLEAVVLTRRLDPSLTAAGVNAAIAARQLRPTAALHVALPGMERQQSAACTRIRLYSLELVGKAQSRAAAQGLGIERLHFAPPLPPPPPPPPPGMPLPPPQPHQKCGGRPGVVVLNSHQFVHYELTCQKVLHACPAARLSYNLQLYIPPLHLFVCAAPLCHRDLKAGRLGRSWLSSTGA